MALEVFVDRQGSDGQVTRERVGTAPHVAPGAWLQEGTRGKRLVVNTRFSPHVLDFRLGLSGEPLAERGLLPSEGELEVQLDFSGNGRVDLEPGVSVVVQTQTLAHPVFEGGKQIGYRPDPSVLPGV